MSFFTPNTESFSDFYEKGKYILAWRIALTFSLIFSVILIINSITNPSGVFPIVLILTTAVIGIFYLKKYKNVRIVFWIFTLGGTITPLLAINFIPEYTHFVDFLWLPTCILVAFIGLGKKEGFLFVILDIIGIGLFYIFSLNNHIEILQPKSVLELSSDYFEIVFALLIISFVLQQFVQFQSHAESNVREKNKELKEQNNIISSKNKENENLLKEIHHRVKNNLQIIISLLRMQSNEIKSDEAKVYFQESINRIMTMSLIHQKLYSTKEISKLNLKSYIEELISEIILASSIQQNEIEFSIKNSIYEINLTTIIPFGLLINELVSNTLKHAHSSKENISILIQISEINEHIHFQYVDNGNWVPPTKENYSFGLELIDILTEQMNGQKQLDTSSGVKYNFTLEQS